MDGFNSSGELFKKILEEVNFGVTLVDGQGKILFSNVEARELLGINNNEKDQEYLEIISCHPGELQDKVKEKLNGNSSSHSKKALPKNSWHRTIYNNGYWVDNYLSVMQYGEFKGVVIVSKDSTEEVELRQALEKAKSEVCYMYDDASLGAVTDRLTGIYNIDYLQKIETGEIEIDADHVGVMMIDINKLQEINEVLGTDEGNKFLAETARVLKESILGKDIPMRYGDDEFLVLLPDCKDTGVKRIRERIEENIEKWNKKTNKTNFNLELAFGCTSGKLDRLQGVIDRAYELMENDKRKKKQT
ncbi:diguanylate cyclase domain-containing protein [Natranaerofaba carboxydovora]|uniref:diguanylate cyclase domain-containing protein n=1 Tax=Natranaerofaba carboxydovora TaxID=2742683 RepID=UPI001F13F379|nr:diguanylate cyclase [Natranaerofaba carboxydovora]UMZ72768.1 Response regulator PleD [Natranaerofaba carboxydovora]